MSRISLKTDRYINGVSEEFVITFDDGNIPYEFYVQASKNKSKTASVLFGTVIVQKIEGN